MLTPIEQREILDEAIKLATQYVRINNLQQRAKLTGDTAYRYDLQRRAARARFVDFLKEVG